MYSRCMMLLLASCLLISGCDTQSSEPDGGSDEIARVVPPATDSDAAQAVAGEVDPPVSISPRTPADAGPGVDDASAAIGTSGMSFVAPVVSSGRAQQPSTKTPRIEPPRVILPRSDLAGVLDAPTDAKQLRRDAIEMVGRLVQLYPASADAQEVKARFHLLVGETAEAGAAWNKALRLDAEYPYALHGMGRVGLLNADFQSAVQFLERAQKYQPDSADVLHDLAKAYTKLGEVEKSAKVLAEYTSRFPESTETFVLLGQAYQANREFQSAHDAYERALELYPGLPLAEQGLGAVLVRLGQRDRAKELLESQRVAREESSQNRSQEEVFEAELNDYAVRYVFAARVFLGQANLPEAEYALKRATVFNPLNLDAWTLLLDLYRQSNNSFQAVVTAKRMVQGNPASPSAAYTLGVLLTQAGDVVGARESFERVVELAPKSHTGYEALVRLNLQTRFDASGTLLHAQQLVAARGVASDYEMLGQLWVIHGQFANAKASLAKAIELAPQNAAYKLAMTQLDAFIDSQ